MLHKRVEVSLGDRSYPVYVGDGMMASLAPTIQQHDLPRQLVLITDSTVAGHYLKPVMHHLVHFDFQVVPIVLPPGERQKSLTRAQSIFTIMLQKGIGRKSAVLALGGGVIGDLAGFVAATYHRGVPLVQIPTTLLSQVDSSIGGKTAVNHPLGKNMIGAFYQPRFVWADVDVLATLPKREVICGLGEIVKYGIIRDPQLFAYVEQHLREIMALDREAVLHVQGSCSTIKAGLVSEDERETGARVILNLGHTVGHALEAAGGFSVLKHGEAVLLGIIAEAVIAKEMNLLSHADHDRIVNLITRIPLRYVKKRLKTATVLNAMGRDKKAIRGKKRFVLPSGIGGTKVVEDVPLDLIKSSLSQMFKTSFGNGRE